MDGNDPKSDEKDKCQDIVPVVIPVKGLFRVINLLFKLYKSLFLVEDSLHFLDHIVLMKSYLVDLSQEKVSHYVGERHGCGNGDKGSPEDHDRATTWGDVVIKDAENAAFPGEGDEHLGRS